MTEYQRTVHVLTSNFRSLTAGADFDDKIYPHETFSGIMSMKKYSIRTYDVSENGNVFSCFSVPEAEAFELVALSYKDADIYDLCRQVAVTNILFGEPLPEAMRAFAISVLNGEHKRPTPAHRVRDRHFMLHVTIFQLLSNAIVNHGLKLTRNDESPALSACDAVSDALANCGFEYTFSQLKALCVSPRKSSVRSAVKFFLYIEHGDEAVFLGKTFRPSVSKEEAENELRKYRASAT